MPLTDFQANVAKLLANNRSPDSHLAGGAALHFKPNTIRYSKDLDYFQDSDARVASAFFEDEKVLSKNGYSLTVDIKQPGYIRCQVTKGLEGTKIEWSHDSAWRFMPPLKNKDCGYQLDPIDLAVNKVLALVGRDEARDFIDVLYCHNNILSLGALCWAASGKDPGFSPLSLLELLKRRGRYQPEDFARLNLTKKIDLKLLKTEWLDALNRAESFIASRPPDEAGCLYYSPTEKKFITPGIEAKKRKDYVTHFGKPGGIIPNVE